MFLLTIEKNIKVNNLLIYLFIGGAEGFYSKTKSKSRGFVVTLSSATTTTNHLTIMLINTYIG